MRAAQLAVAPGNGESGGGDGLGLERGRGTRQPLHAGGAHHEGRGFEVVLRGRVTGQRQRGHRGDHDDRRFRGRVMRAHHSVGGRR